MSIGPSSAGDEVNMAVVVANSQYSTLSNLMSVEKDRLVLDLFLNLHGFEVHVLRNSDNIEKDVMELIRDVAEDKKRRISNFHLYYSGNIQDE